MMVNLLNSESSSASLRINFAVEATLSKSQPSTKSWSIVKRVIGTYISLPSTEPSISPASNELIGSLQFAQ